MNISIIICCYNSANLIKPTLEHLANQKLDGLSCEVILVDNNCTDNTIEVATNVWDSCGNPFTLRIETEKQPGLSYARRRGIMTAKGEITVFCDDDNWLDENYGLRAYNILKDKPDVGVVGGRGEAVSDIEFPFWFSTYQTSYAVGVQHTSTGYISQRGVVWGAGMTLRTKELKRFIECGFNSLFTDRVGTNLSSGGDGEICKWYLLTGYSLFYSEDLIYYHFIGSNRLNLAYLNKLLHGLSGTAKINQMYFNFIKIHNIKKKPSGSFILFSFFLWVIGKASLYEKILLEYYNFTPITFMPFVRDLKKNIKSYTNGNLRAVETKN
jgi:glycosyltransferase involved in cell wall biosynthesis